jgi:hypothetical protein
LAIELLKSASVCGKDASINSPTVGTPESVQALVHYNYCCTLKPVKKSLGGFNGIGLSCIVVGHKSGLKNAIVAQRLF